MLVHTDLAEKSHSHRESLVEQTDCVGQLLAHSSLQQGRKLVCQAATNGQIETRHVCTAPAIPASCSAASLRPASLTSRANVVSARACLGVKRSSNRSMP